MKTILGDITLIDDSDSTPLPYYIILSDCGIEGSVWANAPRDDWTANLRMSRARYYSITAAAEARTRKEAIGIVVKMLKAGLE